MRLRRAVREDARLLWRWANDRGTRAASYSSLPIPWGDHVRWFESKLSDRSRVRLYVAEDGKGTPLGQIRLERRGPGRAEVSLALGARWRGRGLGAGLLESGFRRGIRDLKLRSVFGWVKEVNAASLSVFRRAGFRRIRRARHKGSWSVLFSRPAGRRS